MKTKKNNQPTLKEKYIATLIGCGIGDTLGMCVEGWKKEQIQKHIPEGRVTAPMPPVILQDENGKELTEDEFGKFRYYTRNINQWELTDDTLLTLAIAESLAEKQGMNLIDSTKKQVDLYNKYKNTRFGPKTSTAHAFERINEGESPLKSAVGIGTGNGISMKIAPLGLYMHASGKHFQGLNFARLIGASTHKDERAIAAGIVQAHAVYELLKNPSKDEFLDSVVHASQLSERPQEYERYADKGNLTSKLEWIKNNKNVETLKALEYLGSTGVVFKSYPFSVFMFQKYWDNPMQGLIEVVNSGGDTDTNAAMYSALAGAKNGTFYPKKWQDKLEYNDRLVSAAEKIYKIGENRNETK